MMDSKTMSFDSWTEYDNWLIANYNENSIFKVNEIDGKVEIEYCDKEAFMAYQKQLEEERDAKSKLESATSAPAQRPPVAE